MQAIFIAYDQAHHEAIIDLLEKIRAEDSLLSAKHKDEAA